MPAPSAQPTTLEEIKAFVYRTLCDHEQLEVGIFPMTEKLLVRQNEPCGMYYCLHGPRSVKFTAIWENRTNTILFYGANGERFEKTKLSGQAVAPLGDTLE
ncbi:MAG: hypothetical protein KDB27_36350 [Planctomycetales bacterium]|nr:hypothetical protein [Planctomycetales bacterium]